MPVLGSFSQTVELLNDDGEWIPLDVQSLSIRQRQDDRVTEFSMTINLTRDDAIRELLTLRRQIRVTQTVDHVIKRVTGRIVEKPLRDLSYTADEVEVKCYDETHEATRFRFIDSWPKHDVRTYSDVVIDAWKQHGPEGITFEGVQPTSRKTTRITNDLETLYDFMDKVCKRTGWTWYVQDGVLYYYDPETVISDVVLHSEENILPGVQVEDNMPEVANVVYVPARQRVVGFEDRQDLIAGQTLYRTQYTPLTREIQTEDGPVQLDEPPTVEIWNGSEYVSLSVAEDGSEEAETAQAVYNTENQWVRLNIMPQATYQDGIVITYTAEIPVLVERKRSDSIEVFGEIHHRIVENPRPTREEAQEIADAYLSEHAFPIRPLQMEITEFDVNVGEYVQVVMPEYDIDQIMPVVELTREWDVQNGMTINVTLNRAPVSDRDSIIEIFERLNQLENEQTSQDDRLERYESWPEVTHWTGEVSLTANICSYPSEDTFPSLGELEGLFFDGVDDYMQANGITEITKDGVYTFEAYIFIDPNLDGIGEIFQNSHAEDDRNGMRVNGNGLIQYGYYDGNTWTAVEQLGSVGEWVHVAAVNNAGELMLYVNGEPSTQSGNMYCHSISGFYLGRTTIDGQRQDFMGMMREVRVWNVARTQQEIQSDMYRRLNGNEPGLIGYWKMDEGSGNTAFDSTKNQNHGVIYGALWDARKNPDEALLYPC